MSDFYSARCPYCFKMLKTNNVVFERKDPYKEDLFYSAYYEQNRFASRNAHFDYIDPAQLSTKDFIKDIEDKKQISGVVDREGRALEIRLCPYCHNRLPNAFAKNQTRYIAVVGLPSSGKTAYLSALNAAMFHGASSWLDQDHDANLPLNAMTEQYHKNPGDAGIATQNIQGPYYYGLTTTGNLKTNIILFDVPGEFYRDPANITQHLKKYLLAADGIVFVINAVQDKENQEEAGIFAGSAQVGQILAAFAQAGAASRKNVAILFNKLDKIFPIDATFEGKFMVTPRGDEIDEAEVQFKSNAVKVLLLNDANVDQSIKQIIPQIENVFGTECRIFASSLVNENNGKKQFRFRGAEVPFLWLLSEVGAFPKKATQ